MSEPLKIDASPAADSLSGIERDARVEHLLLQGLDHYFCGAYEQAIHVWTRVLFLDRGHTRARAYIERARSALAERQRETEELLQRGVAAFDRGETGDARTLLTAAVSQGAAPEIALSYLGRIERLTPPSNLQDRPTAARGDHRPAASVQRQPAVTRRWTGLIGAVVLLILAIVSGPTLFELADLRQALELRNAAPPRPSRDLEPPLPLPRAADLALARARELFEVGHPLQALRTLEEIGVADPLSREADRLRADIQRTLLRDATASVGGSSPPETER
jgi:hypothetical protein